MTTSAPSGSISWDVQTVLEQWDTEEAYFTAESPSAWKREAGNIALQEGMANLAALAIGDVTAVPWNNTNARLGVGDSNTAAANTQTGLLGATAFAGMDSGYPQRAGNVITFRATFLGDAANFAAGWREWTIDNGLGALINLNRKVAAFGIKGAGQVWRLTVTITIG